MSTPDRGRSENAAVAVVTGGSRGIGAAISRRLAGDGFSVVVDYSGDREAADAVVRLIVAAGGRAVSVRSDVSDHADIGRLFAVAAELGPVRLVVSNSGLSGTVDRLDQQSPEELRRLIQVNSLGTVLTCRQAVRVLSRRHGGEGGAVVTIASVAARNGGLAGMAAYAGTKAGIVGFTHALALEVADEGIRVNSVSPGTIETDMIDEAAASAGRAAPMGRLGQPEEIAAAVSWLASDDAGFVTGTDLVVAGGA